MIYDTGSDMLTVDSDLCSDCATLDGTYFNTASSSSYAVIDGDSSDADIDYVTMTQYYNNVNYTGYNVTDTVALDSGASTAVSTFPFMAITEIDFDEEHDMNGYYDGFLGFGR